jgi:hypothetical protein
MGYKINVNGINIECDTLEELKGVMAGVPVAQPATPMVIEPVAPAQPVSVVPPDSGPNGSKRSRGSGPKQSWTDAQKYCEAHPEITKNEARLILTKMKKKAKAEALLANIKKRKELGID